MGQSVLRVEGLPETPLDAAAAFHAGALPNARARLLEADALVLVFPPATHDHEGWRLAAVQGMAREAAPKRVNAIVGSDDAAIAETIAWLDAAPGVTGQLLSVQTG
jgi:hypothetical protein